MRSFYAMFKHPPVVLTFICVLAASAMFAQPSNDNCANAIPVTVALSEATCVPVSGTTVDATGSATPESVCSGSWFGDDVWFSFATGALVPPGGVIVKALFGNDPDDVPAVGLAVYLSCGMAEIPLDCFSNGDGTQDSIRVNPSFLSPSTTYYIRVWSGGSVNDDSGTLSICAYEGEAYVENDVIIWGNNPGEGEFEGGLNGWTTVGLSGANDLWTWSDNGVTVGVFDALHINSLTPGNGAALYNADFLQTGGDPDNVPDGPPFPKVTGELISPTIDLTGSGEVLLRFHQAFRGLNGNNATGVNTERGALFSFSLDDGTTWSTPENVNDNLNPNDGSPNGEIKLLSLPGAAGISTLKVKFIFDGDFYYWLIDDVMIIELPSSNTTLEDGIVIAHNYATPLSQVIPVFFGASVSNIGSGDQTNVSLDISVDYTDLNGNTSNDILADNLVIDNLLAGVDSNMFYLPADALDPAIFGKGTYNIEYTLSQDDPDAFPADNAAGTEFTVTDNVYSRVPLDANDDPIFTSSSSVVGGGQFEYGYHFYMPFGGGLTADSVKFAYSIGGGNTLEGEAVTVFLKAWNDSNEDALFSDDELTPIGVAFHTFSDEANLEVVTAELLDFNTFNPGTPLSDDTHYLLTCEYLGAQQLFLGINADRNYNPLVNYTVDQVNSTGDASLVRWSDVLRDATGTWFANGFAGTGMPGIVLYIEGAVGVSDPLPEDLAELNIFPNPVVSSLSVDLKLDHLIEDAGIHILDFAGRLVYSKSYDEISTGTYDVNVSNLQSGTYILMIRTAEGYLAQQFIKH
ncbi:MAG: T9SS type A sorting domain-containing protein [Bacteroidota bacterium]